MPVLKFDVAVREMSFTCDCGSDVRVPFEALRPEPADYCGCGRGWRVVSLEEVVPHRNVGGIPAEEPLARGRPDPR